MRKIVLDTEVTGLRPDEGHRIIELAAIEIDGGGITENRFHQYFNPERDVDEDASEVHGLTLDRLITEPLFSSFAHEIADFIHDAELIIHNAPFDISFMNAEFMKVGLPPVESICKIVTDTLVIARNQYPGKKNSLNALCERFGIDYSHRTQHGAMLDAELLAAVYFELHQGELYC
jgi:DNA polymerase-3 subunit epsilon